MDPSYGLNFISITCNQIVPVKMGFEFKERLLLCPIELSNDENKNMTISFVPKNCVRLLRPGVIRSMHFIVEDLNGEKIYFNSGKVILICFLLRKKMRQKQRRRGNYYLQKGSDGGSKYVGLKSLSKPIGYVFHFEQKNGKKTKKLIMFF